MCEYAHTHTHTRIEQNSMSIDRKNRRRRRAHACVCVRVCVLLNCVTHSTYQRCISLYVLCVYMYFTTTQVWRVEICNLRLRAAPGPGDSATNRAISCADGDPRHDARRTDCGNWGLEFQCGGIRVSACECRHDRRIYGHDRYSWRRLQNGLVNDASVQCNVVRARRNYRAHRQWRDPAYLCRSRGNVGSERCDKSATYSHLPLSRTLVIQ